MEGTHKAQESKPANERRVYIGGLMRCCLATLADSTEPSEVGTILSCQFCTSKVYVREDGCWGWFRPEE